MSKEKNKKVAEEETKPTSEEVISEEATEDVTPDTSEETEKSESVEELKLKKQLEEQNDKYLRLYAEYENYRKRSAKEKTDAYNDAYADVITSFLPLQDNLDRALAYEADNEGFKMIAKQMADIFEKLGIKEIPSDNCEFDPNIHNAIAHEDNEEVGESIITQTFQKGYTLNGKVIRHAIVKVAN